MEVLGVQELGLTILEPLSPGERLAFWAVAIRAGVIRVALMAAVVTLLQVTAENSSPADLDRSHDTALRYRHRSAVLLDDNLSRSSGKHPLLPTAGDPFSAVALQVPG